MNKSEAFLLIMPRSKLCISSAAWSLPNKLLIITRQKIDYCCALQSGTITQMTRRSRDNPSVFCPSLLSSELTGERILVRGLAARFRRSNDIRFDQGGQTLIKGLHTQILTGLNGGVHLQYFGFADQITDGRSANHDFMCGHPTGTVLGLE